MFTFLNKQGVRSSEGYVLQSVHRFYYDYQEGDHHLRVFVEPLTDNNNNYSETVYLESFKNWLPPYDSELLSSEKSVQIQKRVSDALTFMNIPHTFLWTNSGSI